MTERTVNLHDTMDAKVWAGEFAKHLKANPGLAEDEDTMLGWFANAIMAGHDAACREIEQRAEPVKSPAEIDRTATPAMIFDQLGGSVLPMVVSPTGKDEEPADHVFLVSSIEKGKVELGGCPSALSVTGYDYRQSEGEWPRMETVRYVPIEKPLI